MDDRHDWRTSTSVWSLWNSQRKKNRIPIFFLPSARPHRQKDSEYLSSVLVGGLLGDRVRGKSLCPPSLSPNERRNLVPETGTKSLNNLSFLSTTFYFDVEARPQPWFSSTGPRAQIKRTCETREAYVPTPGSSLRVGGRRETLGTWGCPSDTLL